MNKLWARATLRLVDAWACRPGRPEDDDDDDDGDDKEEEGREKEEEGKRKRKRKGDREAAGAATGVYDGRQNERRNDDTESNEKAQGAV